MGINVDDVYKTVLYILNKEQRGYLTPEEFNKIATQVQLEIFEKYFEDLNQQLRIPENSSEYGNRVKNVEEKLDIFKEYTDEIVQDPSGLFFYLPENLYKLGSIFLGGAYSSQNNNIEIQPIQRDEYFLVNKSPLTKPSLKYPVYILEGTAEYDATNCTTTTANTFHDKVYIYPTDISSNLDFCVAPQVPRCDISVSYIRKPKDVIWAYTEEAPYNYYKYTKIATSASIPTNTDSVDFEIQASEQSEVIIKILLYAGVVIRDPQIVRVAQQEAKQDEINEKS